MLKFNIINVDENLDRTLLFYLRENKNTQKALIDGITNLMSFKSEANGTSFDSLTLLAINYFFDHIYVYHIKGSDDKLKKHRYKSLKKKTIAGIKGIFDACNYTPYVPIETIENVEYVELFRPDYYTECYLIIQIAYFFGSNRFGIHHPYIRIVEHYRLTGKVLPNHLERERLESAFKKIDDFKGWKKDRTKFKKKPIEFTKDRNLNIWYYGVLDILANVLGTCKNYRYEYPLKDGEISEYRLYNKFIQTPRILRKVQPFEMIEFDIKSGHLSYIDLLVGSNVAKTAYENYAKKHNVSRDTAKRKFQSILNLRKFRNTQSKIRGYLNTLCGFGYSLEQAKRIFYEVTDAPDRLFGNWATEYENKSVNEFAKTNNLKGWTRGHDAVYCLKMRNIDYSNFCMSFENGVIQFELQEMGLHQNNFTILQHRYKKKKCIYFSGLQIENVINKKILGLIPPIVMRFKDCVTVTWHKDDNEKREHFAVSVNLNYHQERFEYYAPKINCSQDIQIEIVNAYNTILVLNDYNVSNDFTYKFCQHIRKFLLFDVITYSRLLVNECGSDFLPKKRSTRISLISKNNENNDIDFIETDNEASDAENAEIEEFNYMVAINKATGICTKEFENMQFLDFLKQWIYGNTTILLKPKKYEDKKDLKTKMHEIDSIAKRSIVSENTFFGKKSIDIISESIIRSDFFRKVAFCPRIDRKRTRKRQEIQLARQERNWYNDDKKRTRQLILAKEIALEIDFWFNYKSKYNIEYVTK